MGEVSTVSLVNAAIAAVAALMGVYELWLFGLKRRKQHLWVALLSMGAAFYSGLMVVHYNAGPEAAVLLSKLETAALTGMFVWVPLLASAIVGRRMPIPLVAFVGPAALIGVLLFTPYLIPDEVVLRRLLLLDHPFPRYADTPVSIAFVVYAGATVIWSAVWLYRNAAPGDRIARYFSIAAYVWIAVGFAEVLLALLRLPAPMTLFEFGYVGFAGVLVWGHARELTFTLAASQRDFRTVIERAPDPVLGLRRGRIVYANAALLSILGRDVEQLEGRPTSEILGPGDDAAIEKLFRAKNGARDPVTIRVRSREGALVELEATAVSADFYGKPTDVVICRDVTARRRFTARQMEMDRLVSVGTLATAVGHEINNPLAYIILNIEEARKLRTADPGADVTEHLEAAADGAGRIRETVNALRFFARPDRSESTIYLDRVIRSAAAMASNEIRHRAKLHLDLNADIPLWGNETRLSQVFVNLLINAAQAIPAGDQSSNEIRVSCHRENDRAVFLVSDTGAGIEAERLERVFDAFYTTKPEQGTGLGLGISRETIREMGGDLQVTSEVGRWTTFRGELPVCEPEVAPGRLATPAAVVLPRRSTILLVDDEPLLIRSLARTLRAEAEVLAAESLSEAMELIEANPQIDLILTDVMMPNGSGIDLFNQLQAQRPALADQVVFMSGGVFTEQARTFRETTANPFLEKPLDLEQVRRLLLRAVKDKDKDKD